MERIQWLAQNDLLLGIQINRMDEIFRDYTEESEYNDINDIMEIFVVCKYMKERIYPTIWDQMIIEHNIQTTNKFKGIIGRYFNAIIQDEVYCIYNVLEYDYIDLFWEAFRIYKLYKRVEFTYIKQIIDNHPQSIRNLLLEKEIVDEYGEELRKELLKFDKTAELLLEEYEEYHEFERQHLHFPNELTIEDKKQIFQNYIEWDEAHFNYLGMIVDIQDNPNELVIGDKLRLQAKKRVEREQKELFSGDTGFKTEIIVVFAELETDEPELDFNTHKIVCKYNTNWIRENLDGPTLLNNFFYWFGYFDSHWRISLVEKDIYKGITERFMFMRSRHAYQPGYSTNTMNLLADMQMAGYYQQLEKNDIQLENVLKWFFEEYLKTEFSIEGFRMNVPTPNISYLEKCRMMLSEMDGVLKQYNLYIEDGYVDQELFQISSSHLKMKDCKSVVKDKYVYGVGENFRIACHYLFSDQSHITYVKRIKKSYDSFYELLNNEVIFDTDFGNYTKSIFEWLIENRYITIDDHQIKFDNLTRIRLMKQLNDNNVIAFEHLGEKAKKEIKRMAEEGMVIFESSLFAKKEYEYFDYYLNRATFNNGRDLRNMYLHGSQPNGPEDEKVHESNYWIILKLFVLCVMKINDDLETKAYIKKHNLHLKNR